MRCVLCTPGNINDAIAKHVPRDATAEPAPPPAAATPAAAQPAPQAAAPAPAAKPSGPMTEEEKKQRRDLALIATFGTGMVFTNVLYWGLGMGFVLSALAAFTAGAIAGGITWKVKSR